MPSRNVDPPFLVLPLLQYCAGTHRYAGGLANRVGPYYLLLASSTNVVVVCSVADRGAGTVCLTFCPHLRLYCHLLNRKAHEMV